MLKYFYLSTEKRFVEIVAGLVVLILAFYIMDTAWTAWDWHSYYADRNEELFNWDCEYSGKIYSYLGTDLGQYHEEAEIYRKFWEEISALEGIGRFGAYEAQISDEKDENGFAGAVVIVGNLWDLCDLKFSDGDISKVSEWDGMGVRPVILGCNAGKNYKVGDIFYYTEPESLGTGAEPTECIVIGILQKDSWWLSERNLFLDQSFVSLDDVVMMPCVFENSGDITVNNIMGASTFVYEVIQTAQPDRVHSEVNECLRNTGFTASNRSVSDILQEDRENIESEYGQERVFACMLMLIVLIYAVSSCIISFLKRRHEFGTLIACGYGRRFLCAAEILRFLIQITIALAVALVVREVECNALFSNLQWMAQFFNMARRSATLPRTFVCAGVLLAVYSLTILLSWNGCSVIDLIRGEVR